MSTEDVLMHELEKQLSSLQSKMDEVDMLGYHRLEISWKEDIWLEQLVIKKE